MARVFQALPKAGCRPRPFHAKLFLADGISLYKGSYSPRRGGRFSSAPPLEPARDVDVGEHRGGGDVRPGVRLPEEELIDEGDDFGFLAGRELAVSV